MDEHTQTDGGAVAWETVVADLQAEIDRLKPFEAEVRGMIETARAKNAARVAKLPEGVQSLIPTGYDPLALAAWLDANEGKLRPVAPNLNAGQRSTGDGRGRAKLKKLSY